MDRRQSILYQNLIVPRFSNLFRGRVCIVNLSHHFVPHNMPHLTLCNACEVIRIEAMGSNGRQQDELLTTLNKKHQRLGSDDD